jgi:hypothetical protein
MLVLECIILPRLIVTMILAQQREKHEGDVMKDICCKIMADKSMSILYKLSISL